MQEEREGKWKWEEKKSKGRRERKWEGEERESGKLRQRRWKEEGEKVKKENVEVERRERETEKMKSENQGVEGEPVVAVVMISPLPLGGGDQSRVTQGSRGVHRSSPPPAYSTLCGVSTKASQSEACVGSSPMA